MDERAVRTIRPAGRIEASVTLPPSKSYTNRALIAAALADGTSRILFPSASDDSRYLIEGLREFGVSIEKQANALEVSGTDGHIQAPSHEIFVGNAGTTMRFLAGLASLAPGETVLVGDDQMNRRPIKDLLDALRPAGVKCSCEGDYPPVRIRGGNFLGGRIDVDASASSQFVSSLLLSSPYAKRPVTLHVTGKLRSEPYVDMTLHVMRSFGAKIDAAEMKYFLVDNHERYIGHSFAVEADASAATYFLAAAAINGGKITICNLSPESLQGDARFVGVLEDMGCSVLRHDERIELSGGRLRGIEVDMNEMPDCVPTLAVVAAFAEGPTTIADIGHLRYKETNRLAALTAELAKLGARVGLGEEDLLIRPDKLHGATIETYNDHRIAMSFAVAGLKIPGVEILNPACVTKSFPGFWEEFTKLETRN